MRAVVLALCLTASSAFVPHYGRVLTTPRMSTAILSEADMGAETVADSEAPVAEEPNFDEALSPSEPDFSGAGMSAPAPPEPKLFVANLNFNTSDEDLMEIFSKYGTVTEAHHVNDRFDPDKRRGFGFILFESMEAATAAVEEMHNMEIDGRNIVVDFATAKGERPRKERREPRQPRKPRADDTGRRIYVGNLDYATTDETLKMIFSEFGEIEYCAHLSDREDPSRKRGFGFVTLDTAEAAEAAVANLDGLEVDGRGIRVNLAQPRAF